MKVFVASDHRGYSHKSTLVKYLQSQGYEVIDDAPDLPNPDDDYPLVARKLTADMLAIGGNETRGILICGSGQGMCMAANRFKGIRAALGYDRESVRAARNDDDANVLCLGVRAIEDDSEMILVDTFLKTPYAAAARYTRRIQEMDNF